MATHKNYMLNDKFPKHIKNATSTSDGLMSALDKSRLDELFDFGLLSPATPDKDGFMTREDKAKLDDIEEGANNYIHPDDENTRHVTDEQIARWDSNIVPGDATGEASGLLSPEDKAKLDSIEITKIENIKYTLSAEEFANTGKVSISIPDITEDTDIMIGLDNSVVTLEQYNAAGFAKIIPRYNNGNLDIICLGTIPTIDIPIKISLFR